jgi:sugar (pentulose or hexulose) kinase
MAGADHFIGVDVGTSGVKALLGLLRGNRLFVLHQPPGDPSERRRQNRGGADEEQHGSA